jgi:alkylhydroperoxidase family enzyme
MALLHTVAAEDATGKVKEVYDQLMKTARVIPRPMQMMSASPDLLAIQVQFLNHYFRHPTLSFALLAHIRLLVSHHFNYPYCIEFNSSLLQMLTDITDEQLEAVKADPAAAPLSEKDKAMLLFVLKCVKTPDATTKEDIDALKTLGWTEKDIFEATQHGADMVRHGILFKAFKMAED